MASVPHSDVVPQLDPALVSAGRADWWPVASTRENLRIRPARPGRTIGPPVLVIAGLVRLTELDRQAKLSPGVQRRLIRADLVVAAEHGRIQALPRDSVAIADEIQAPAQTLRTAVVAQRP